MSPRDSGALATGRSCGSTPNGATPVPVFKFDLSTSGSARLNATRERLLKSAATHPSFTPRNSLGAFAVSAPVEHRTSIGAGQRGDARLQAVAEVQRERRRELLREAQPTSKSHPSKPPRAASGGTSSATGSTPACSSAAARASGGENPAGDADGAAGKVTSRWSADIDLRLSGVDVLEAANDGDGQDQISPGSSQDGCSTTVSTGRAQPERTLRGTVGLVGASASPAPVGMRSCRTGAGRRSGHSRGLAMANPTVAERNEAWLKYREQKRAVLREKCESGIGSFTPRLCRPERSPRWMAGPEGGGDLHERGLRAMARQRCRQRRHEEEQLLEDMRHCPFAPDISESWPLCQQSAAEPAKGSEEVTGEDEENIRVIPAHEVRHILGQITPQRASKFYEQQLAWQEACLDERDRRWEAQRSDTLSEEARVTQRPDPGQFISPAGTESVPSASSVAPGILPRTVYDRQILWRRQRDNDLEEMRRAQLEEMRRQPSSQRPRSAGPKSGGAAARGSSAPPGALRCCPSALHSSDPSSALVERLRALREQNRSCSSLPGRGARHTSGRSHSAPTTPRRAGNIATTPRAATPSAATPRGAHISPARARSASAGATPRGRTTSPSGKSGSADANTPRSRAQSHSGTSGSAAASGATTGRASQANSADVSSMALVERLRAARMQSQRPQPGGLRSTENALSKASGGDALGASQPVELVATEPRQRVRSDTARNNIERGPSLTAATLYGPPSAMTAPEAWALEQREEVDELLHVLTGV